MNNVFLKTLFCILVALNINAQSRTTVKGYVKDADGKPIPYVNVFIEGSFEGAMTNESGYFEFVSSKRGKAILSASIIGYEKFKTEIELFRSGEIELIIVLKEKEVELKETVISASSYGSEKEKGLVINRMDVLTTPGGAADLYQSLKTMPGITHVSESAELYVRGGDPLETVTMINQTPVYHPYTLESSYGGLFSNLKQSAIKSVYFSSGGFSVKYGNALSGVLDIETKDLPVNNGGSFGLSLASLDLSYGYMQENESTGIYADFSQSYTDPIFWLNGGRERMTVAPVSRNFTAGAIVKYSKSSRLKLFVMAADDKQGVNVERAEYNGVFNGNSSNYLVNLQSINPVFKNLLLKTAVGYNRFKNLWKIGTLDIEKTENVISFRSDAEYRIAQKVKLLGGFEFESRRIEYLGKVPYYDYDIRPGAEYINIDAKINGDRAGLYTELQYLNLFSIKNLSTAAGIRYDKIFQLNAEWADPRFSLSYKLSEKTTFRFGAGMFRQMPDPRLLNPNDGNPDLKPMRAKHYIFSYEFTPDDNNSLRMEFYYKDYDDLPAENDFANYDNSGYGFAKGIDLIYKGIFPYGITGWISYGYIDTKRKWIDFENLTRSSYDITHNLNLVMKFTLSDYFQLGFTCRYATGRPYTPVVGAVYKEKYDIYEPIYGADNSVRFPDYKRIDLRLTYYNMLFNKYYLVVYAEALNIFGFKNLFGYSYLFDYGQKKEIESYFGRRMLVFGFMLQI
ncbi:MAG: TonB-dependent receptor [Melioribacter sp.]|uniref:TonB-dependent receptor n=1 Tax=Melioribacter sp. TaxID=2052167 RepID=UPI003BBEEE90